MMTPFLLHSSCSVVLRVCTYAMDDVYAASSGVGGTCDRLEDTLMMAPLPLSNIRGSTMCVIYTTNNDTSNTVVTSYHGSGGHIDVDHLPQSLQVLIQ